MMNLKNYFTFFTACLFSFSLLAQSQVAQVEGTVRVAFYNVENLFDTIDDPNGRDEEFLPSAEKAWTLERYQKKIDGLVQVFTDLNQPAFIGLCEVENERVMLDLAAHAGLRKANYQTVHFESPDYRGIDVGLLYKKKDFKVLEKEVITINFPREIVEDYTTRDVLVVTGVFRKCDTLSLIVNHWPSRRGGLKASSPKREYVAEQVRKKVAELYQDNSEANVIIMGDFNDEPDNISIKEVLLKEENLANAMLDLDLAGEGTYNYRGAWNMIDQFVVSKSFYQAINPLTVENIGIFKGEYLFYKDKKYGNRPSRTYGGSRYFGGYSDHLPIYLDLNIMKKKERKKLKSRSK